MKYKCVYLALRSLLELVFYNSVKLKTEIIIYFLQSKEKRYHIS